MNDSQILSIARRTCREYRHNEECKYRFDEPTLVQFVEWVNSKSEPSIKDKLAYVEDNYVLELQSDLGSWYMTVLNYDSTYRATFGWLSFDECVNKAYKELKDD